MENKEYCIFEKETGKFVFTSSTKPQNYIDDPNFEVIYHDKLDFHYSYSLVNGEIIQGEPWPSIEE